jgi:hypothetical protein
MMIMVSSIAILGCGETPAPSAATTQNSTSPAQPAGSVGKSEKAATPEKSDRKANAGDR